MPGPPTNGSSTHPATNNSTREIQFTYRDRLNKLWRRLKNLHLPASLPSESYLVDFSSSESTPPVPRHPYKPRNSREEDEEPADEIIVDSLLLPAAVSTSDSRRQSSVASSGGGMAGMGGPPSQTGTLDRVAGWSEMSQSSSRVFRPMWLRYLVTQTWQKTYNYFDLTFDDKSVERHYQKESWYMRKPLALMAAVFILISWILALALIPRPWSTYDHYAYIGISGFFSLAIPVLVICDAPRYRHLAWQIFLILATWSWPFIFAVEINLCGYFETSPTKPGFGGGECGNKDFSTTLYYAAAFPVLSLFSLKQSRAWAMFGSIMFCVCLGVTIIPTRVAWIRNLLVFLTFMIFINIMSYNQERIDRRMFLIRDQLKLQYRATQKAQHLEHKAADSKKRFVSYIFHEVRVPLNSALLAIQNLAGEGIFVSCDREQREMVDALTGSLGMMAKVLNDVLDFNRMEDGKLVCAHNQFDFHKVVRSTFVSARAVAENKGVTIVTELDERIDQLYDSKIIIGDEMRVRQVLSNLTSNACKFTHTGGSVKVLTRLLYPTEGEGMLLVPQRGMKGRTTTSSLKSYGSEDGSHRLDMDIEDEQEPLNNPNIAIIRMEVQDTGCGIRRCELVDNRLFSPYVQTEEGRRQGGKGTGLGLALVRHIVKLSGGRLGVQSRLGVGSTFWVELPLGLQDRTDGQEERGPHENDLLTLGGGVVMGPRVPVHTNVVSASHPAHYHNQSLAMPRQDPSSPSSAESSTAAPPATPRAGSPTTPSQSPPPPAVSPGSPASAFAHESPTAGTNGSSTSTGGSQGPAAKAKGQKEWKKVRLNVDSDPHLEPYLPALAGMHAIDQGALGGGPEYEERRMSMNGELDSTGIDNTMLTANSPLPSPTTPPTSTSPTMLNESLDSSGPCMGNSGEYIPPQEGDPRDSSAESPQDELVPAVVSGAPVVKRRGSERSAHSKATSSTTMPVTQHDELQVNVPGKTVETVSLVTSSPPPVQDTTMPPRTSGGDDSLQRIGLNRPLSGNPLSPSSYAVSSHPFTAASDSSTPRKLTLLVVDDDKITRLLMSRLLTRLGHVVHAAEDGSIALNKLIAPDAPVYDCVFLDNQMPVMTGVECIQHMRDRGLTVWACGVTGNAMKEDQDEFYDAGIDRVLTKPVREGDVRDMLDVVLGHKPADEKTETWRGKTMSGTVPFTSRSGSKDKRGERSKKKSSNGTFPTSQAAIDGARKRAPRESVVLTSAIRGCKNDKNTPASTNTLPSIKPTSSSTTLRGNGVSGSLPRPPGSYIGSTANIMSLGAVPESPNPKVVLLPPTPSDQPTSFPLTGVTIPPEMTQTQQQQPRDA